MISSIPCLQNVRVVSSKAGPALELNFKSGISPCMQKAAMFSVAAIAQAAFIDDEYPVLISGNRLVLDVQDWSYESDVERALHTFSTVADQLS